ncbi:YdcF family protein [Phytohalomonas tamaricis]|uniref:YdcF family protein n=1 Tax=Phytohalomonas tamaricis TaxID=2081032 RepID=UPI000D0BCD3F|nr:YdcF family protein [Phytohalomonas tamaricis]
MMMQLLKAFLLPPGCFLLALLVLMIVWNRIPRLARALSFAVVILFWAVATPPVASLLLTPIERVMPTPPSQWHEAQAIVILGGGRDYDALELGGRHRVNEYTLGRLSEGARIARKTGLPILVTGGKAPWERQSEAELMKRSLEEEFGLTPRWLEGDSRDTTENAEFTARILKKEGIDTILLVTNAWHMPRAVRNFEKTGLKVLPAPFGFTKNVSGGSTWWAPKADALERSYWALYEYLGWFAGH